MQILVKTQVYKVKLYINNIQRTQPNPLSLNSSEIWAHLLQSKVAPVQIVFENHRRAVHTKQANRVASEDLKASYLNTNFLMYHNNVADMVGECCV